MHEASIALSIISIAEENCRGAGYGSIESIEVSIGASSAVNSRALAMAFDAVKADSLAANALLNIKRVPLGGVCMACKREFQTGGVYLPGCPHCGGGNFMVSRGREMDITHIEVN